MTEVPPAAPAAAAPAKATKKKTVARPKKVGPSVSDLIIKAVSASKERSGVSLPALKKVLTAEGYDVEKSNARVKIAIRSLLEKGTLVHTKGIGASGSFKISKDVKKPAAAAPKAKKAAVKKPAPAIKKATPKRAKKPAAKKSSPAKKATTPKKGKKPAVAKKAAIKKSTKKVATKKVAAKPTKKPSKPVAKKSPAKKATKPKVVKKAAPKKK